MKKTTVLYHADNDGFGSAFAIWLLYGDKYGTYIPVQYSQPVPEIPEDTEQLFIVDFSYKREICEDLAKQFSSMVIFDHHKTAEKELEGLSYVIFDQSKSGVGIVWDFFYTGRTEMPDLLKYVQDYDLWKFKLPHSEIVNLYISTLDWDFNVWKNVLQESRFAEYAYSIGLGIKKFQDKQIDSALSNTRMMRFMFDDGVFEIPVINCSANVSKVGNVLCKEYPDAPFSATYCDRKNIRSWSLRSVGDFDVSFIARKFAGGGHKNAAGFSTDIGWPQHSSDEFVKAFTEESK